MKEPSDELTDEDEEIEFEELSQPNAPEVNTHVSPINPRDCLFVRLFVRSFMY